MRIFSPARDRLVSGYRRSPAVTIRWALPADAASITVLAQLDNALVPPPPLLLAFVGDELWVALSLRTGALISDPFRPSSEVAALVLERGRQLIVPASRPRPFRLTMRRRPLRRNALTRMLGHETS